MQSSPLTIRDSFGALARRRIPLLITAIVIFLLFGSVALLLPAKYISKATILIERQEIPQDLVRSVITSFADQRIYQISQRVMTNQNLNGIIGEYDLYSEDKNDSPLEVILERMRKDIVLAPVSADVIDPRSGRPSEATIAFTLSYENSSPRLAQRVANELVSLFLQENIKERSSTARETSSFLADEANKLKVKVEELETDLATFKERNIEALPELGQLNWRLLDQVEAETKDVDRQLRAANEQLVFFDAELSKISPTMNLISETGERILTASDRLQVLETELVALSARYGQRHPDVVRASNEVKALRGEVNNEGGLEEIAMQLELARNELQSIRNKYSVDHPDVKKLESSIRGLESRLSRGSDAVTTRMAEYKRPNNPAYIQLRARSEAARSDIRTLVSKKADLAIKAQKIQKKLEKMPQVEREYSSLRRGYDNAVLKYQEVLSKTLEAEVSQSLETEQKGERFTLIEPPILPERPAKPNRLGIIFVGTVFSFLGGLGSAGVAEALDTTIRGRKGVTGVLGAPPLAAIPDLMDASGGNKLRVWIISMMVFLMIVAAIVYGLTLYFDRPIDVLWFQALRQLGFG